MTLKSIRESQLEQLTTFQLPTLPAGTPLLLKSLTDENIDFFELASIIENFPSIAGKLMFLANSVWSAPVSEINSLESACSRLGFAVVRSTSIALAIATPFNPLKCVPFDPEYFWCSALLTADAASMLVDVSSARNGLEPSTARTAGLLHNLGLLWLVDRLPTELAQALTMVNENQRGSLQQALHELLGFDQAQAGGQLAKGWGLPEPLTVAMSRYLESDYQGPQSGIVSTIGLAVKLVSATLKDRPCPEPDFRLQALKIAEKDFYDVFEQLKEQIQKIQAIAKILI